MTGSIALWLVILGILLLFTLKVWVTHGSAVLKSKGFFSDLLLIAVILTAPVIILPWLFSL